MPACLIGLGANVGQRERALRTAVERLAGAHGIWHVSASPFHETAPVGGPLGQPQFLNAAARFHTWLPPRALLALLQNIEQQAGRDRAVRWGPRTLDLDLLLYGNATMSLPGLEVPHPWMTVRRFVLEPAVEVAADWPHPRCGKRLGELAAHLAAAPRVARIVAASSGVGQEFVEQLTRRVRGTEWVVSAEPNPETGRNARLTLLLDAPTNPHAQRQSLLRTASAGSGPLLVLDAANLPRALDNAAAALAACD